MSATREFTCARCGAVFFADKRHKYCSEACCNEAHRQQSRERFRQRFATMHEQELARNREYYWRNKEKANARCRNYYRKRKEEATK